jgi:ABC-type Fe3+ transport system permease subunit
MKWVGFILALLGAAIAILGMVPFLTLIWRDPTEVADHSGMLMTFCWFGGGTLFGIGLLMAVHGRLWHQSRAV